MTGSLTTFLDATALFNGLQQQITAATGFSPVVVDFILAALIIVASVALAKLVKYFVSFVAPRLVVHTKTSLDDEIIKAVNGPLQWTIVALGTFEALQAIGKYAGFIDYYLDRLLLVVLLFVTAYLVNNLINALMNWYKNDISARTETKLDDMLIPFLQKILTAVIFILALIMALDQLDIVEVTPLITGLGVAGIAVALAAQSFLSDFFGALSIMLDRPYRLGDRVKIEGIEAGDVIEIGLRSTRIRTTDNRIIIVPNAKVSKSKVINVSMPDAKVYLGIRVGVSYDADVDRAARIMEEIAASTEGVSTSPPPKAFVNELGNFAVRLVMFPYVSYRQEWVVPDRIYRNILKRFAAEGIEIPVPITNVQIKREPVPAPLVLPAQPAQANRQ
ncbi:MAG: Small-conductance mechanosensitive channel MscMJ [Methanocella sp. PtaU1.Bin125]|nr:MAG: Small-conductance mechanosensitive channel MscMJ [Methanocella sp. PtaU1.Bin125]